MLTRFPNLIIIALTQYFTAIFLVGQPGEQIEIFKSFELLILASSTVIIAAAGYIINDYYDIKIDYINKPEKVIVGRLIRRRIVLAAHLALNFAGIGLGLLISWKIAVINFVAAFCLWLYSNQLKRMPIIGNIMIAFLTGLAVFTVAVFYDERYFLIANYAVFAASITLIREIIKDMEDIAGDERYGSKTLPIVWGISRTKKLLFLLIAFFIILLTVLATNLDNPVFNNFILILLIPVIYFMYLLYRADSRKRFSQLSNYCKLFMLAGILSMIFF